MLRDIRFTGQIAPVDAHPEWRVFSVWGVLSYGGAFQYTGGSDDPENLARLVFERRYLEAQISRFGGNVSKTADFVGMERSALHRKLKSLGVSYGDR